MQVTVTIRHIDNQGKAENLRNYVIKKIKRLERYTKTERDPSEVKVVFAVEKFRNIAEVFVNSGTFKAASSVEGEDMYSVIDRAIDSIIKQLKKQARKKIKIKRRNSGKSKDVFENISEIEIEIESPLVINKEMGNIKVERVMSKPMSVEEAVLQLGVSDIDFLAFCNSETGQINVVYKRKGEEVGLIVP